MDAVPRPPSTRRSRSAPQDGGDAGAGTRAQRRPPRPRRAGRCRRSAAAAKRRKRAGAGAAGGGGSRQHLGLGLGGVGGRPAHGTMLSAEETPQLAGHMHHFAVEGPAVADGAARGDRACVPARGGAPARRVGGGGGHSGPSAPSHQHHQRSRFLPRCWYRWWVGEYRDQRSQRS
jgi:hypothetical protein